MDNFNLKKKNFISLGLLLSGMLIVSLIFPFFQMLSLLFMIQQWVEGTDCGYCRWTELKIIYSILLVAWTLFSCFRIWRSQKSDAYFILVYMLVGYRLVATVLALIFEKEALRSMDMFLMLHLYYIELYASITPILYGLLFHVIVKIKLKQLK